MTKYRVYLNAVAETHVDVEATDEDEAIEFAFEKLPRGANISNEFDMTEWSLPSDIWGQNDDRVTDVEEV